MPRRLCEIGGCGYLRPCPRHGGRQVVTAGSIRRASLERRIREIRSSYKWKKARAARLRLDDYRCTWEDPLQGRCPERNRKKLDVHHVDPLAVTDENAYEIERLRTLCRVHHRRVERVDRAQAERGSHAE